MDELFSRSATMPSLRVPHGDADLNAARLLLGDYSALGLPQFQQQLQLRSASSDWQQQQQHRQDAMDAGTLLQLQASLQMKPQRRLLDPSQARPPGGKYLSRWTSEEDAILLAHVTAHGTTNWGLLKSTGLLPYRDNKACCNRFILLKKKFLELSPSAGPPTVPSWAEQPKPETAIPAATSGSAHASPSSGVMARVRSNSSATTTATVPVPHATSQGGQQYASPADAQRPAGGVATTAAFAPRGVPSATCSGTGRGGGSVGAVDWGAGDEEADGEQGGSSIAGAFGAPAAALHGRPRGAPTVENRSAFLAAAAAATGATVKEEWGMSGTKRSLSANCSLMASAADSDLKRLRRFISACRPPRPDASAQLLVQQQQPPVRASSGYASSCSEGDAGTSLRLAGAMCAPLSSGGAGGDSPRCSSAGGSDDSVHEQVHAHRHGNSGMGRKDPAAADIRSLCHALGLETFAAPRNASPARAADSPASSHAGGALSLAVGTAGMGAGASTGAVTGQWARPAKSDRRAPIPHSPHSIHQMAAKLRRGLAGGGCAPGHRDTTGGSNVHVSTFATACADDVDGSAGDGRGRAAVPLSSGSGNGVAVTSGSGSASASVRQLLEALGLPPVPETNTPLRHMLPRGSHGYAAAAGGAAGSSAAVAAACGRVGSGASASGFLPTLGVGAEGGGLLVAAPSVGLSGKFGFPSSVDGLFDWISQPVGGGAGGFGDETHSLGSKGAAAAAAVADIWAGVRSDGSPAHAAAAAAGAAGAAILHKNASASASHPSSTPTLSPMREVRGGGVSARNAPVEAGAGTAAAAASASAAAAAGFDMSLVRQSYLQSLQSMPGMEGVLAAAAAGKTKPAAAAGGQHSSSLEGSAGDVQLGISLLQQQQQQQVSLQHLRSSVKAKEGLLQQQQQQQRMDLKDSQLLVLQKQIADLQGQAAAKQQQQHVQQQQQSGVDYDVLLHELLESGGDDGARPDFLLEMMSS